MKSVRRRSNELRTRSTVSSLTSLSKQRSDASSIELPKPATKCLTADHLSTASEEISSEISDPAISSADSKTCIDESLDSLALFETNEEHNFQLLPDESEMNDEKNETELSASDLIRKSLAEINRSGDISQSSKKIFDAMFEAAIEQIKGEAGSKKQGPSDRLITLKVRITILGFFLLFLLCLITVRLTDIWSINGEDSSSGLPPT